MTRILHFGGIHGNGRCVVEILSRAVAADLLSSVVNAKKYFGSVLGQVLVVEAWTVVMLAEAR